MLFRAIIIGLSVAAPLGPIGVLCVQRTLIGGRRSGFFSGLGAATADSLYASVAGFGLTFISVFLIDQMSWIRSIGGLFLCYLGVRAYLASPTDRRESVERVGLASAYGSTFALTLTNPMTILSFAGIFAGLGIAELGQDYVDAVALVLGVFVGSVVWWFSLSGITSLFRERFDLSRLAWVNRISGLIMAGFGVAALVSAL